jgi:hypothetical protein
VLVIKSVANFDALIVTLIPTLIVSKNDVTLLVGLIFNVLVPTKVVTIPLGTDSVSVRSVVLKVTMELFMVLVSENVEKIVEKSEGTKMVVNVTTGPFVVLKASNDVNP